MTEVHLYDKNPPIEVIFTQSVQEKKHKEITSSVRKSNIRRRIASTNKSLTAIREVEETFYPIKSTSYKTDIRTSAKEDCRFGLDTNTTPMVSSTVTTGLKGTKQCRTSSKTGILYFAFGADISPSYFKFTSNLQFTSSARPIALARLHNYQWIISARGIPNIVPLCEPGSYYNNDQVRAKSKRNDASVVYGLVYNLKHQDESEVDRAHGYHEDGPNNIDDNPNETGKRPFLQSHNFCNKLYERFDIMTWLTEPMKEGINVVKHTMSVRCLVYVDESFKGLRPGRIWDDEAAALSTGATEAVKEYGMPKRWIQNTMYQYGVQLLQDKGRSERPQARHEEDEEAILMIVEHSNREKPQRATSNSQDNSVIVIET